MKSLLAPALFIVLGTLTVAWNDPSLAAPTAIRSFAASLALILLIRWQPVGKWLTRASRVSWLGPLADVALLTLRLIRILEGTLRRVRRAQESRLGSASGRARLRSANCAAAHLLPESVRRARAMERALDCRLAGETLRVLS